MKKHPFAFLRVSEHVLPYVCAGLLSALLSCRSMADPASCPGAVDFQASAGSTPTFTWQPSCLASSLIITTDPQQPGAGLAAFVWGLSTAGDVNRIASPVTYGIVPPGAQGPPNPPHPLVAGSSYRLTLYNHVNGGDGIMAFTILKP